MNAAPPASSPPAAASPASARGALTTSGWWRSAARPRAGADPAPPVRTHWDARSVTALIWIAFLLLHAALFWLDLHPAPRRLFGDEVMYRGAGERAAQGLPLGLDLLWPPLYGWFVAGFAWIGASVDAAPAAWPLGVAGAQVALLAAGGVLFRPLVARLTGSPAAARCAQAFLLLDPQIAAFAHYLWPEILHLVLVITLLWLLVLRPGRHGWWWIGAGLAMGALCLTKLLLVPFLPVWLLVLVRDLGWRRGLPRALGLLGVAGLVILPTVIANAQREGAFIIADSSRFNLWVGLNQQGRRSAVDDIAGGEYLRYRASGTTFAERQQVLQEKIATRVAERGSLELLRDQLARQYFRLFDARSVLVEQLPGGPYAARGVGYADPDTRISLLLHAWSLVAYGLVLAAAGPGLTTTPLRGRIWLWALFALFAYGLVIFLGLEARTRFRIPMMLPLQVAAAIALTRGVLRAPDAPVPHAARRLAGALVSVCLLWLAFGGFFLP